MTILSQKVALCPGVAWVRWCAFTFQASFRRLKVMDGIKMSIESIWPEVETYATYVKYVKLYSNIHHTRYVAHAGRQEAGLSWTVWNEVRSWETFVMTTESPPCCCTAVAYSAELRAATPLSFWANWARPALSKCCLEEEKSALKRSSPSSSWRAFS